MATRADVLRLVEDQLALNAVAGAAAPAQRLPRVTQIALDMAKVGTCGTPAKARQDFADTVESVADREEDYAASEPLRDLAWLLKVADDDITSRELCVQGLGAVWRTQLPFRSVQSGDPYDLLIPQIEDRRAVMALDRARALPSPPVALLRVAHDADQLVLGRRRVMDDEQYNPILMADLLTRTRAAFRALDRRPPSSGGTYASAVHRLLDSADVARDTLQAAQDWATTVPLRYHVGLAQFAMAGMEFEMKARDYLRTGQRELEVAQHDLDSFERRLSAEDRSIPYLASKQTMLKQDVKFWTQTNAWLEQAYEAGRLLAATTAYVEHFNERLDKIREVEDKIEWELHAEPNPDWGDLGNPALQLKRYRRERAKLRALFPHLRDSASEEA